MEATTLDPAKLGELRTALLERRDTIQGELDRLDEELRALGADQETERGGLGNHLAEDGSNVTEQERILAVSADLRDIMVQVDEALERMDAGTYGICRRCGKPINPERLEAFPYVAYCIECQSLLEREQALRLGR
jgi:DnaK suppressor protein